MITEDDIDATTILPTILRPLRRHDLYRALESENGAVPLWNAVHRAAAAAQASASRLRQAVETLVAEGREDVASGFVHHPDMPEEYLLDLCGRGVLTAELGHRPGPRALLRRMCEVHRHPEAVLTLGLALYRDPAVPTDEFAAFVHRYGGASTGWLLRTLAEATPDPPLKQAAYESALDAATQADAARAAAFHARHLANEASVGADHLARFLDRHTGADVLVLLLDSPVPDRARGELIETRAQESSDPRVVDALRRRRHRREASDPSLDAGTAAALAAAGEPDVLLRLAANPRTPEPVLRELSRRRASDGARAIRAAATRTLGRTRRKGGA